MANNIGWGLGILNNSINWGLGAVNNSISWGNIQETERTWSGETDIYGTSFFVKAYSDRVIADGGVVESLQCVDEALDLSSKPIITLIGSTIVYSDIDAIYSDLGATAFDEIEFGDLTSEIVTTSNVNSSVAQVYEVKYNLIDPSGKKAKEVVRTVYITSELVNRYRDRVVADGGVVESLQCADVFRNINWSYYFRVTDDNGIVESLECVNNIN
tara:strand:- start:942 stop:1583 length:642 start_codon:yes stop_codon:yes gene_type:complete